MRSRRGGQIWDPLLRSIHWLLAASFLANYWLVEGGEDLHQWLGYGIAGLLLLRLIWGFVGPHNARFSSFFPTLPRLRQHWQSLRQRDYCHEGHNPLGACMILFLLSMLMVTAVSGWMQELDRFWGEDWVQDLHEISASVVMVAVVLHVLAVLFMSWLMHRPLLRAMISGK
jgi:cytochrome b